MNSFSDGKNRPKLLGSKRKFTRHGQAGTDVSECLPHITASIVDDLAVVRLDAGRTSSTMRRRSCS